MALTGIQIYKLLPKTNCKDCGYPTCLAFAMKLAAKQEELSACPHVSEESKAALAESAAPPVRLVTLKSNGNEIKVGNETVLFRHEKTFVNKPGVFFKVRADLAPDQISAVIEPAEKFSVNYVGIELALDGFAIQAASSAEQFSKAVSQVRSLTKRPLILMADSPEVMAAGLRAVDGENPLIYAADAANFQAMAALAKQHQAALVVKADSVDELAELTPKLVEAGVEDLVLDPGGKDMAARLIRGTQIRRLALKKNFRPLGYPLIAFASSPEAPELEPLMAAQAIAKYAGFVVLDHFAPEMVYPLLVLRQNIYTDPQKPIQVLPGLYEINSPKPEDPVLVTTNFSITYFSVANEIESSGMPAWLLVTDAEGMSVLTAWAAGKFDAERIAKDVKAFNVADKVSRKRIVLPGNVAVLSGELEEELPGWEIKVGPREAVDINSFLKHAL